MLRCCCECWYEGHIGWICKDNGRIKNAIKNAIRIRYLGQCKGAISIIVIIIGPETGQQQHIHTRCRSIVDVAPSDLKDIHEGCAQMAWISAISQGPSSRSNLVLLLWPWKHEQKAIEDGPRTERFDLACKHPKAAFDSARVHCKVASEADLFNAHTSNAQSFSA